MDRMGNRDETQDGHYTHMFWKDGKKGLSKTTELLKEEIKIHPYKRKILSMCKHTNSRRTDESLVKVSPVM
jgi:hypothetical protein